MDLKLSLYFIVFPLVVLCWTPFQPVRELFLPGAGWRPFVALRSFVLFPVVLFWGSSLCFPAPFFPPWLLAVLLSPS